MYDPITFGFIHQNKSFWYQMKALIFLIAPVKYDMQQMLNLKVTSESEEIVGTNVSNLCYVFAFNLKNQHLFYRVNEKVGAFF